MALNATKFNPIRKFLRFDFMIAYLSPNELPYIADSWTPRKNEKARRSTAMVVLEPLTLQ